MSNPSPLIPQGTFQAQANKGASNVRIAVATIVAIHVVFFGGLLLQGCKRDTQTGGTITAETNPAISDLTLPPRESAPLYYSNVNNLPLESTSLTANPTSPATSATDYLGYATSSPTTRDTLAPGTFGTAPAPRTSPFTTPEASPMVTSAATSEYTVVRGDTYTHIAAAKGVTVEALKAANPGIEPRKIRPGMKLNVPAPSPTPAVPTGGGTFAGNGIEADSADLYTVKPGDNLTRIARAHGITISQLKAANGLKTSSLRSGQKLKIPAPSANK